MTSKAKLSTVCAVLSFALGCFNSFTIIRVHGVERLGCKLPYYGPIGV